MNEEIADGDIHPLNEKLAYILLNSNTPFHYWDTEKLRVEMFMKYHHYLRRNREEEGKFWFIEKTHPHSLLGVFHTLALKFERSSCDDLETPNHKEKSL